MIGMEYAAAKASPSNSKPPTLASSASSTHSTKQPNGQASHVASPGEDEDPQIQLINTLRTQLTDTHNQLSQLNSKLVQSYDRVSHLEDTLEFTAANLSNAKSRINELEAAQRTHEAALETGMLVEREHVTSELSRLMERATEEAAQRGQADAARSRIERELDDLSADLFERANTMVAEARIARAASERRVEEAEGALKSAEDVVKSMQIQMQQMVEARKADETKVAEMRARMNKGKWVEREDGNVEIDGPRRRLYNSHTVYREFVAFVSHLRGLRASASVMPQLSSLTSLPFVARLIVEDCDPTLRLDLAPALNWLTRRAVHAAILQGQLEIEPVYGLHESECALCGLNPYSHSLPGSVATSPTTTAHPLSHKTNPTLGPGSMTSWASSTSKYLKGAVASPTTPPETSQHQIAQSPMHRVIDPNAPVIYVFRIANAQTNPGAAPLALCSGGWCLARLRATCELCTFLKGGVIEKVWSEPPTIVTSIAPTPFPQPGVLGSMVSVLSRDKDAAQGKEKEGDTPPVPPRRRQLSQLGSSLWEKGLGAFGGSRSASRSGTPVSEEPKESLHVERRLPPPPAPAPSTQIREKLSIVPPPPPPRARPVPPVPSKPEVQETHDHDDEHHEDIQHAMVFDAAADEHGHHALSPTTDKRHSIPITLTGPLRPITVPKSPTDTLATLPESTVASEAPHAPSEHAGLSPLATKPEGILATEAEATPTPTPAPETARAPPPITRPHRTRPVVDGAAQGPMSPHGIPLPDSRPGTPAFSARNTSPSRARTPSPSRLRAASPSVGSPSPRKDRTGSIRRDVDSIRASSPVPNSPATDGGPPKIPRRAPRRAAPVPPGTPSRSEKRGEKEAKEDEIEKKVDEAIAKPEAENTLDEGVAKSEDPKPEGDEPKAEDHLVPRPPPRRTVPPPPAPPLPVRARSHKPEDRPQLEETDHGKPNEAVPTSEDQPDTISGAKGDIAHEPPATTALAPTTNDNIERVAVRREEKVNGVGSNHKNSGSVDEKKSLDEVQFVGEQTWEERAYREIVKLREDMFWARVGSAW